jgi:hypothetical protein
MLRINPDSSVLVSLRVGEGDVIVVPKALAAGQNVSTQVSATVALYDGLFRRSTSNSRNVDFASDKHHVFRQVIGFS